MSERPDPACVTFESFALHSAAGTFHSCAAASISMTFAAAPAIRMPKWPVPRTALLPPVTCMSIICISLNDAKSSERSMNFGTGLAAMGRKTRTR